MSSGNSTALGIKPSLFVVRITIRWGKFNAKDEATADWILDIPA